MTDCHGHSFRNLWNLLSSELKKLSPCQIQIPPSEIFAFLYVCLCKYVCVIAPLSVSRSGYLQEFCLLTLSKFTYGEKFSGISFVEI